LAAGSTPAGDTTIKNIGNNNNKEIFLQYISIDGDDIGRKITAYYISNDNEALKNLSSTLNNITNKIASKLKSEGFHILFCAADGVVAYTEEEKDFYSIFDLITKISPPEITFSAGVGSDLRETYMALTSAKSNGKNCLHKYSELSK
jgi:hypothetical protein